MQKINFKVAMCHNDKAVVRRFTMEKTVTDSSSSNSSALKEQISFESLKAELITRFKLENLDGFTVQYEDDEDQWVTFSSDEELAFAAMIMNNKLNLQIVSNTAQHHEPGNNRACGSDINVRCERQRILYKQEKVAGRKAHLERLRDGIKEKISALQGSENPKAAVQMEKLQQRLVAIHAKLEETQIEKQPHKELETTSAKNVDVISEQPLTKNARLEQQRDRITKKISALQTSTNPKAVAQVEKLQQKLVTIDAKLATSEQVAEKPRKEKSFKKDHSEKRTARKVALLNQREILTEKISTLRASETENPKAQNQLTKLEKRVQSIDTQLRKIQSAEVEQQINAKLDCNEKVVKNNEKPVKQSTSEKRVARRVALMNQRGILTEKISTLRTSKNPKVQSQIDKLEKRVQSIDAQLQKFQFGLEEIPAKKEASETVDNKQELTEVLVTEISDQSNSKAIVPVNKSTLAEARAKHKALRSELKQYKSHIGSLSKFLGKLRNNPTKDSDDSILRQTENFLSVLQSAFSEKQVRISYQAGVMQMLSKRQPRKSNPDRKKKQAQQV